VFYTVRILGLVTGSYWSNSNVASLSGPTVSLQCYSLLLLYFGQINDDDDDETLHSLTKILTAVHLNYGKLNV